MKFIYAVTFFLASLGLTGCTGASTEENSKTNLPALTELQEETSGMQALANPAAYFQVGSMMSTKQVIVYFDAQCPHCATLWKEMEPLITQGKISAKWAPVKFLSPLSAAQGAMLVASDNPQALMSEHEASLFTASRGLVIDKNSLNSEIVDRIGRNNQKMIKNNQQSVPAMFIVRPTGVEKYDGLVQADSILAWINQ